LEEGRADYDATVIPAQQKEAAEEWQNKDRQRPGVGMDRKFEQKSRYAARNWSIQEPRNETVLRLAH